MRCADLWRVALLALAVTLTGCGGGNSTETKCIGASGSCEQVGPVVVLSEPSGDNTTEIVVDSGPLSGFSSAVANLPYVTVTVCAPGSTTACATIDHVFLDTGSIGLRLLRSAVANLNLPPMTQGGSTVVECLPFVIGAVWGPMARADLKVAGESALNLPIQIIDDSSPPQVTPTANCQAAANGDLLNSVGKLQANGVLGVGMLRYDCGLACAIADYSNGYTLYYTCSGNACNPAAVSADLQVQNPVSYFKANNNGTLIVMPAVPETGASLARGRLVFGIGTQGNNQRPQELPVLYIETDPTKENYFYLTTTLDGTSYPNSYVDSGSNGFFFDNPALPTACSGSGAGSAWYCPKGTQPLSAVISDTFGTPATVNFSIASTDVLFSTSNTAFGNLGGAAGSGNPGAFVWGMPFFYGRRVFTSIWGQALSPNGPWVSF
jgi:hypothetical protein